MNETEILFTEILNCDRFYLYENRELILKKDRSSLLAAILKRRMYGQPIQYILGKTEFMGLEFKLTPYVFIPRQETEILVETALNYLKRIKNKEIRILDLGTGSGCIGISLAKFFPQAEIDATDISDEALKVAKENAILNNVEIDFIRADLFNSDCLRFKRYRLIVSNPPYIATKEIDTLASEIKYEPRIALDGGKDGLDFYRRIIKDASDYLEEDSFLIMEMGFNQRPAIEAIFNGLKDIEVIKIVKDYNNIERVIVAKKVKNG
ncbi:MAG: peptide chain release factor N(5)-glutamine methyltransferase [Candidatus Omnitrophica bacterium]|nr:peptide chain release factor N(5)-glutamine methyltransferase [Candidatus Omnitrophota bacterium]